MVVLPWVSVVEVEPTPPWFLPGLVLVVQVTVPWSLVQLSASGAATADIIDPPIRKPVRASVSSVLRIVVVPLVFRAGRAARSRPDASGPLNCSCETVPVPAVPQFVVSPVIAIAVTG